MRDVYIVDFARTAFGRMGGGLRSFCATELGGKVIEGLMARYDPELKNAVDGVVAGCAFPDEKAISHARFMAQLGGLPFSVNGTTAEMACGSSLVSINVAAWKIAMGAADVMLAGGAESHSRRPAKFSMSVEPYKAIPPMPIDQHVSPFPEEDIEMIDISDKMAKVWNISREECDEFACASQQRLADAVSSGLVGSEIVPVVIPATKKTPEIVIDKDEQPRPGTTIEGLAKLRAVNEGGVTTAGNASGVNDGAAFVLLMTEEKLREFGLQPVARWIAGADVGCQPSLMGIGAAYAAQKVLKMVGKSLRDLDVIECNEAFAAQNLSVIKELEAQSGISIDRSKWNPNGGAIAIGHPNGASGARITGFAMRQLERSGGRYGLATTCCGGGQGVALLLENLR